MSTTPQLAPPESPAERLPHEWAELLASWGEPGYRAGQVFRWIHQRGVWDPDQMSDLPKALRARLAEAGLRPALVLDRELTSQDGTRKLLLALGDARRIESVLIPRGAVAEQDVYAPPEDDVVSEPSPASLFSQCISSQVGCAMGCAFCASGIAGLKRNLSAAEIIAQVALGRQQLAGAGRLSGVVLMGMGEPLHNYDAVARALALLSHPEGIGMSPRRVTLSTSGLVEGIARLGRDFGGQVGLAVSVHAADDQTRSSIMPVNKRHGLDQLFAALRAYPLPPRRSITIEYTLIEGVNDAESDARALATRLRGLRAKVNLIPMNGVSGSDLHAPSVEAVDAFQRELLARGLSVFVRRRRGDDIAAACGQLALHGEPRKIRIRQA
jgi:23S rRNA (adenine2503-C2)-methyltransferase